MNRKLELAETEVDNPFFSTDHPEGAGNPRKVRAFVNRGESAIINLRHRKLLNDHQFRAAIQFCHAWETMHEIRRNGLHEYVDIRRQPSIPDDVVDAGREMRRCREQLGLRNYMLLVAVCGYGKSLPEMFPVKRQRLTAADNLRASLDELAWIWGYMHRRVDIGNHLRA
jgi:hypothetical protein